MRIVEYRIPLPFSIKEYNVCQRFNIAKASFEQTINGPDGVHILTSQPIVEDDKVIGQYTHKRISVASKVPSWIQGLVKKEWLSADEMSWNTYPKFKTCYKTPFIPNLEFTVLSMHCEGVLTESNALNVNEHLLSQRSIINIDIINDPIYSKDYKESEDPNLCQAVKERYGTLSKDWKVKCPTLMTCYKVLLLQIPLGWGVSGRVENWIVKTLQYMFLLHHRRALCTLDKWTSLTVEKVRCLELQVQKELDKIWAARINGTPPPKILSNPFLHGSSPHSVEPDKMLANGTSEKSNESMGIHKLISNRLNLHQLQTWDIPSDESGKQNNDFSAQEVTAVKKGLMCETVHEGYMYKLGDGYLNRFWYLRYMKLEGNTLKYYGDAHDEAPRDTLNLCGASVRWSLEEVRGRFHSLVIEPVNYSHRTALRLSCDTEEETKQWMVRFQLATLQPSNARSSNDGYSTSTQPNVLSKITKEISSHKISSMLRLLHFRTDQEIGPNPFYLMRVIGTQLLVNRNSKCYLFPSSLHVSFKESSTYTQLVLSEDDFAIYVNNPSLWSAAALKNRSDGSNSRNLVQNIFLTTKVLSCILLLWLRSFFSPDIVEVLKNAWGSLISFLAENVWKHGRMTSKVTCYPTLLTLLWRFSYLILLIYLLSFLFVYFFPQLLFALEFFCSFLFCSIFAFIYIYCASFPSLALLKEDTAQDFFGVDSYVIASIYIDDKLPSQILPWILSTNAEKLWNKKLLTERLTRKSIHTDIVLQTHLYNGEDILDLNPLYYPFSLKRALQYISCCVINLCLWSKCLSRSVAQRHWGMLEDSALFVATGPVYDMVEINHDPFVIEVLDNLTRQQNALKSLEKKLYNIMAIDPKTTTLPSTSDSSCQSTPFVDYMLLLPNENQRGVQLVRYFGINDSQILSQHIWSHAKMFCLQLIQEQMLRRVYQLTNLIKVLKLIDTTSALSEP